MHKKLFRWVGAAIAGLAIAATPADAAFLQELGSPFVVGTTPYGLVSADFNRDGLPDLVSVNGGSDNATLLVRQAGGGFAAEAPTPAAEGGNFGSVADFNRDGWPDFAVSGYDGVGTASVSLRNPAGGFVYAPRTPAETNPLGAIAAADFTGDGRVDLAVAQITRGLVRVVEQQVDGSFIWGGPEIATGVSPRYLATADFNGDALPDLAVTNHGSANVAVLLGQPGGGLAPEAGSPFPVGVMPWAVVAADINGDGRTDLAVADGGSDTVTLLERGAAGGFTPMAGSPVSVPGQPVGLATADFNRDGRLDLAVSQFSNNTLSVLLRQPNGAYVLDSGSPLAVGTHPHDVVATDFNRDGKPDLATTNNGVGSVSVLLNTTPDPTPPPPPPPPAPTPAINARLVLTWTVAKTSVKVNSATLRDLPAGGATVKVYCKTCKVSQTIRTTKRTLTLTKLRGKRLKRKATFTVTVSKPGYNGLTFSRKVKNYGRTKAALRKAVKAPFSETRRVTAPSAG
ncbi:VCBS repeat-containing protein [Solirubrobacter taibaiensis]|nr:VCBS repeat-containing protein [Solirubrobacter taibaiensis]